MIELIVISAFIGFAFQSYIETGMIFGFYGKLLKKMYSRPLTKIIAKPLGGCIICNTFWIGIIIGILMKCTIIEMLIIGVAASGVVILLKKWLKRYEDNLNPDEDGDY